MILIPLLLLYSEFSECKLSTFLNEPAYNTSPIEYVLDLEYNEGIESW